MEREKVPAKRGRMRAGAALTFRREHAGAGFVHLEARRVAADGVDGGRLDAAGLQLVQQSIGAGLGERVLGGRGDQQGVAAAFIGRLKDARS